MKLISKLFFAIGLWFSATLAWAGVVNINSADAETLAREIQGVGMVKAEAIVSYRKEHGPFRNVDELAAVKGIGARTVEKNRNKISVGSEQQ